jgi:hypothetical protein
MKKPVPKWTAIILATCGMVVSASAQELTLFDGTTAASIVYDKADGVPLAKVAALLAHDLTALTGANSEITSDPRAVKGTGVMIGLAVSPRMAAMLKANGISTAPIAGKWETYGRAVVPAPWNPKERTLVIFGSDTRGAIWGVIDLTRELGVSPWEWWADVETRRASRLAVDASSRYSKEPTVKYRGLFLNAGAHGLNPWSRRTFDPELGDIGPGPKTYARIFELMWRLKANFIWPAMTSADTPFNQIPENARTAADYAIVRGSSHVEMLLRTNSREWDPKVRGPYNWLTNRKNMIDYWTEAVRKFGQFENMYTIGLRNMDDFPMQGVKTPEQIAHVLTDVIAEQRKILASVLKKPAAAIPQAFTLYKEVLPAYMTGQLKLPDDVTMIWPDDDFGYIRQLSNPRERGRRGGSGVYYHNVFWGPPMCYLWLAATDPSLMWEEMTKAARFDARGIWVLNVGSIKPCEFLSQLFLAMAFDVQAFGDGKSVHAYLKSWVTDVFGKEHAEAITDVLWRYYKLAFDRNPEFMAWTEVFPETPVQQTKLNMLSFGDENARRAAVYKEIMSQADALMTRLPADRKAAFYQLVQYPVTIAGDLNLRQLDLDKAITYGLQHRASADVYAQNALKAHEHTLTATRHYNEEMAGGKWRHMMDTVFQDLPVYQVPHVPSWSTSGDTRCGVQVEGGAYFDGQGWWTPTLPTFHPELPRSRTIDVFVEGPVAAIWTATPSVPWIKVDRASGSFSPETKVFEDRIQVSIDWAAAPKGEAAANLGVLQRLEGATGDVVINCSTAPQPYGVHVAVAPANATKDVSFIEVDRIVSMYAVHADSRSDGWERLDGLGHVGASLRTSLEMKSVDARDPAAILSAPRVTYRFATATTDDKATLSAIALPTFPITAENGVRIAVAIDDSPPQILDFAAPEFSQAWREHALTNAAIERLGNLRLAPGAHTLTVYALDPGVTIDRLEIAFAGAPQAYLPVPETRVVDHSGKE